MQIHALKNCELCDDYNTKDTMKYLMGFVAKSMFISIISILTVIMIVALLFFGDILYNSRKGNNVVPLFGGYIIVTPSMVPTLQIQDAVVVKRSSVDDLKIGDIITFKSSDIRYNNLVITHRIVGAQKISTGDLVYRTKGDNNKLEDSALVTYNSVYGKVVLKIPRLGFVKVFLNKPVGFITLVIMPIILLILLNLKGMRKEII